LFRFGLRAKVQKFVKTREQLPRVMGTKFESCRISTELAKNSFGDAGAVGSSMDEIRRLIEGFGYLFHITSPERWENIRTQGFCPETAFRINGEMYRATPYAGRGFVCFTIESHLKRVVQMMSDGMGSINDKVILKVPAAFIAATNFDLDRTHVNILKAVGPSAKLSPNTFRNMLEEHGYIVCFDRVPPEKIDYVMRAADFHAE
jgi:hypothetical protein